jgi:hypothetical protein
VCDDLAQLLAHIPEIESPDREFAIDATVICKDDQPPRDGWRWEKWGPYIGTQVSQADYLYDEPVIEMVLCFSVHERIDSARAFLERSGWTCSKVIDKNGAERWKWIGPEGEEHTAKVDSRNPAPLPPGYVFNRFSHKSGEQCL